MNIVTNKSALSDQLLPDHDNGITSEPRIADSIEIYCYCCSRRAYVICVIILLVVWILLFVLFVLQAIGCVFRGDGGDWLKCQAGVSGLQVWSAFTLFFSTIVTVYRHLNKTTGDQKYGSR